MPMRRRSGCSSRSREPADVAAFDEDLAGIGPLQTVEAADQRRLAGAAAADDAEDLALAHVQRNAVQRRSRAEPALQVDQAAPHRRAASARDAAAELRCEVLVHRQSRFTVGFDAFF